MQVGLQPRLRARPSLIELLTRARQDQSTPWSPSFPAIHRRLLPSLRDDAEAAEALEVASLQPLPNSPSTPEFPSLPISPLSPTSSLPPGPKLLAPQAEELPPTAIDLPKMASVSSPSAWFTANRHRSAQAEY